MTSAISLAKALPPAFQGVQRGASPDGRGPKPSYRKAGLAIWLRLDIDRAAGDIWSASVGSPLHRLLHPRASYSKIRSSTFCLRLERLVELFDVIR
jgi:hypothetical protein